MPRPRLHDEDTREALREAAERLFDERGAAGVTVRAVAQEVGTTTRAVYSLFGSREALLVDSMQVRAYELLERWLHEQVETQDPAMDLVEASVTIFRRLVVEHPTLFRITFQRALPEFEPGPEVIAARASALRRLTEKVARIEPAGLRPGTTVDDAVVAFQAMCEGMGNLEMRGAILRLLPAGREPETWRSAFTVLVAGLTDSQSAVTGRDA